MRSEIMCVVGVFVVVTVSVFAQIANDTTSTNRSLSLTTIDGRLFKGVRVTRKGADAIAISHSTGICTLKHAELSGDSLVALGLPRNLVVATPMRSMSPSSDSESKRLLPQTSGEGKVNGENDANTNRNPVLPHGKETKVVTRMCQACICPQCKGGTIVCATCKGTGRTPCRVCEGTKVVSNTPVRENCTKCNGRGQLQVPIYESMSGGVGKRSVQRVSGYRDDPCKVCGARGFFEKSGKQQCIQCNGQGIVSCNGCGGAKGKPCNLCRAQGRISSCKVCNGAGTVQVESE